MLFILSIPGHSIPEQPQITTQEKLQIYGDPQAEKPQIKKSQTIESQITEKAQETTQITYPITRSIFNPSRGLQQIRNFTASAYDLSYQCCGKRPGDPGYGVTCCGENLIGKTREEAKAVAIDPDVIPLGSRLYIVFPERPKYNGIYTAVDTGAFKGAHIDLFMGDFNSIYPAQETIEFGRTTAQVIVF
jgi:3D (Asp-Asp-Asp) domain-containing protein